MWPDASQYMVFAKVGDNFESLPKGTPEFNTAVKAWVTFWAGYIKSKGLRPEQFALLLVDEPDEPFQDERILAWAKPIHAVDTGIRIWEDVTHEDMNDADEDMIDACHVLSPNYQAFLAKDQDYRDYFLSKRDQGIGLEYYTAWPSRVFDPYAGRIMAWTCWRYGATAFYLWSLTDTGHASSWNEYLTIKNAYSPIFIDEDSVTAGKHLEAAREGVEDYEYFAMLDRAIREASARGITGPELEEARRLLESLPASVCDAAGHRGRARRRPAVERLPLAERERGPDAGGRGADSGAGGVDEAGRALSQEQDTGGNLARVRPETAALVVSYCGVLSPAAHSG